MAFVGNGCGDGYGRGGYCNQSISKSGIDTKLSWMTNMLCRTDFNKRIKLEKFRECIRFLSQFSVDPRGGYQAFDGLNEPDPTKYLAIYIDNLRGEYDPNIDQFRVYHVTFCIYGDTNGVCRSLRQKEYYIGSNVDEITGQSLNDRQISVRVNYAVANPLLPAGLNNGFLPPTVGPTVPGTSANININNPFAIGGSS